MSIKHEPVLSESKFSVLLDSISAETGDFLVGIRRQLKPKNWMCELFHDKIWDVNAHFLLDGIFYGFHVVNPELPHVSYYQKNYWSCYTTEAEEKLSKLIWEEMDAGKLARVNVLPDCIHSMGAVRKTTGGYRPITDCSEPGEEAINSYMESIYEPFKYIRLEDILGGLCRGQYLSVIDLQAAYRAVMIHPSNRKYFGLCWHARSGEPIVLQDNFLCFGTRTAPVIFNMISDSISRMMHNKIIQCWNYLDDFLISSSDMNRGFDDMNVLIKLLRRLGFYISWPKLQGPATKVLYLGFEIDTMAMTCKLPESKLLKLDREWRFWKGRRYGTRKQLQRLVGLLIHACRVVRLGRLYMNNLFDCLHSLGEQSRVKLDGSFFEDIYWWELCARQCNGI